MKKLSYICIFVLLTFAFVSCNNSKTQLQEVTNTSKTQSKFIEKVLEEQISVKCDFIEKADMSISILENMSYDCEAYNVVSEDGKKFILILNSKNKDVLCILDEYNDLAFGLVDNGILPKYFENKENN